MSQSLLSLSGPDKLNNMYGEEEQKGAQTPLKMASSPLWSLYLLSLARETFFLVRPPSPNNLCDLPYNDHNRTSRDTDDPLSHS